LSMPAIFTDLTIILYGLSCFVAIFTKSTDEFEICKYIFLILITDVMLHVLES